MPSSANIGPIAHLPAEHQAQVCRLLPILTRLGISFEHRGTTFAQSFDGSILSWTMQLYRYGRRFHWVLAKYEDGRIVHYSDIATPNMRHEGNLAEGLFDLSPLPAHRKAEILGIRKGPSRGPAKVDRSNPFVGALMEGADRIAGALTPSYLSPKSA